MIKSKIGFASFSCKANGLLSAVGGGHDSQHSLVEASFQVRQEVESKKPLKGTVRSCADLAPLS